MNQLQKDEMLQVKGGVNFSSALLNGLMRTVDVMFNIGQAVGSAFRRAIGRNYC